MATSVKKYIKQVTQALKDAGKYHAGLSSQILALAGSLRSLELANEEIDGLDCTTVVERSRYGEKTVPHPVFKIQRDAADCITRQLKQLGLTPESLGGGDASDPLVELTQELINVTKSPRIIKPILPAE